MENDHKARMLRATVFKDDLLQDCRYSLRGIRRNKLFSVVVLLVLAIGIGVNTAVFAIINAEIIQPLPFRDPSRLVTVWDTYLPQFSKVGISPAEFQTWQMQRDLFKKQPGIAMYRWTAICPHLAQSQSQYMVISSR